MGKIQSTHAVLKNGRDAVVRSSVSEDADQTLSLYRSVVDESRHTLVQPDEFKRTVEQERNRLSEFFENEGGLLSFFVSVFLMSFAVHNRHVIKKNRITVLKPCNVGCFFDNPSFCNNHFDFCNFSKSFIDIIWW